MKRILLILLTASCCYGPLSLAGENPLKPYTANYTVEHDDEVVANSVVSLQKTEDGNWRYESESRLTSLVAQILGVAVNEQSEWSWDNHVQVHSYRYKRSGKEKHVHLRFDWQQMKVTNTINGDPWQMDIPAGTQDKLSINLALMAHLAQSETDISIPVADGGKLKTYDYKILGRESITTALGPVNTIKVTRNKRGRKDRQAILWLAPELGYVLVRMEKTDKDGEIAILKIQQLD